MERVARLSSWWVLWMGVVLLSVISLVSETRAATFSPGFYIELVDGPDPDNVVSFSAIFVNRDDRTYWVGIASTDHTWYSSGEEVPPGSVVEEEDNDFAPGVYDVYLTWVGEDGFNTIWTSQPGMADYVINDSDPSPTLAIAWQNGIDFSLFAFTFNGDGFRVQPVPLPAGVWLLGGGLVGVALGRKFKAK